jgi:hypothetical protein
MVLLLADIIKIPPVMGSSVYSEFETNSFTNFYNFPFVAKPDFPAVFCKISDIDFPKLKNPPSRKVIISGVA